MENKSQESSIKNSQKKDPEEHLRQVCESTYGEPIKIVFWRIKNQNGDLEIIFREQRRGWYFQMLLRQNDGRYMPEYKLLAEFLELIKTDEALWAELTQRATEADWLALDRIILSVVTIPGSEIFFAGQSLIGADVSETAMDRFGCYVPNDNLLPVFVFENRDLGMNLISYFKDPDRFAGENLVQDNNTDQCEAYTSLSNAQLRLKQQLDFYSIDKKNGVT